MKKIGLIIGIILLVLILGVGIYFGVFYNKKGNIKFEGPIVLECDKDATIDEKISKTIIANCLDKYEVGQHAGEGHIILGTEEKEIETFVYALATYGKYDVGNGRYIRLAGTEITPIVVKLSEDENGSVVSSIIWVAKDENIIKQLFPEEYHEKVIIITEEDKEALEEMEYEHVRDTVKKEFFSKPISEQQEFIRDFLENKEVIKDPVDSLNGNM